MRSRGPLAATLLAILAASCSPGRASVTLSIGGEVVPTQVVSNMEGTPCSGSVGDGPFDQRRVSIVRASSPIAIGVKVEPSADIRGWIYDVDAPTPSGGPLEEFALSGSGTHQSRSMVAARTYRITLNVVRSALGFSSSVTHAVLVRIDAP